jgi:protein-L-isoaspartate O-methyltransferase
VTAPNRSRSRWDDAISRVPREWFIPEVIYRQERDRGGNDYLPVSRSADTELWWDLVRADAAVITQVEDGHPGPDGTGYEVTSSASQPDLVVDMLECLDPQPDDRVLEIGTGTGWNAAVLASVLGADNVSSIEVDAGVADQARASLDSAGFGQVRVVTGEGLHGWPAGAPYHRLIATCGVATIPWAWVAQTVVGGRLVVPVTNTYQPPGIAVLTRTPTGATGHFAGPAVFMSARAQRQPRPRAVDSDSPGVLSHTNLHPYRWVGDRAATTAIGQRISGITTVWRPSGPATGTAWLYAPATSSWASVEVTDTRPYEVEQGGHRRLFDEIRAAYRWWLDHGKPSVADWSIDITTAGQRIALRPPDTAASPSFQRS